jgi:preprotein translocase SecE subunit
VADADKPVKRRIRKVETVRQKAEKAQTPKQPRRVKRTTQAAVGKVNQVSSADKGGFRIFRVLRKLVRGFFGITRHLVPRFFREAWAELRQVKWPNRRETFRLTSAVVIFAIVFGTVVALTDYGLDKFFRQLLLKYRGPT